jgi:hypothetical protein
MERSTREIDDWIDSLKIAIIEDKEETIYEHCTNIPEDLINSHRLEEACTLISGAIGEFEKRREETRRILNSLQQNKRYFSDSTPAKKGKLDIRS